MHGNDVADGTDWAMRIITFPVPQAGFPVTSTSCAGSSSDFVCAV